MLRPTKPPLLVVVFSIIVLCCAVWGARAAEDQKYEAIIRIGEWATAPSRHVTTRAKNSYEARDNIENLYCPQRGCIVNGPWPIFR